MDENIKIRCRMLGHALLLLVGMGGIVYFVNEILMAGTSWNKYYLLVSAFLAIVLLLYCLAARERLFATTKETLLSAACFLLPAFSLPFSEFFINVPVWAAGGMLAAALLDRSLGLLYLYFFTFQAIYLQDGPFTRLALQFLIAAAACLLLPKRKGKLSGRGSEKQGPTPETEAMADAEEKAKTEEAEMEAEETVETEAAAAEEAAEEVIEADAAARAGETIEAEAAEETIEADAKTEAETDGYAAYCDESSALLLELKERSKSAYAHSKLVAKFAGEAAEKIHANAPLVRAAALHHEIGRLCDGAVAEQTLALLKERDFPEEIIGVLREFFGKEKKEEGVHQTKEAAILLLSDKIVSMYKFLRKSGTDASPTKIVDQTMAMQMQRREGDASGFSAADCDMLRDYFIGQLTKQDKKLQRL